MADHAAPGTVEIGGIVDDADHERTYRGFLRLLKYATLAVAVLVAIVIYLV